jgi:NitT/TauT family transport system substrate-binding protein
MRLPFATRATAGFMILAVGLAACASPAASPRPTGTPAAPTGTPSTGGPTAEPSPTQRVGPPPGQASSFTVAETAIGLGSLPFLAAIDELRKQGYTIDAPELAESELVTEGVVSGRFQFGSGANNAALLAMDKGGRIKFIVDRNANEWTIVTTAEIETCEQLAKSRLAIHSPGSVSGAMVRDWINNNCAGAAPWEPLIISGSQNRAAALLAGQIDSTPAELRDWLNINETGGDKYRLFINFAEDLPRLRPTSMYGNTNWMEQNPDVVKDLIREILLQNRRINSEPGYLLELYKRYLPEEAAEASAKLVTDTYAERRLFDSNGGLTREGIDYTTKFFGPSGTGALSKDMSVDDVSDLSYLDAVLDELGRQ